MGEETERKNICKECGHANELERVYCHNCDKKLPYVEKTKVKRQKKKKKIPGTISGTKGSSDKERIAKLFLKIIGGAAAVGLIACLILPPPLLPNEAFKKKDLAESLASSPDINMELDEAANKKDKKTMTYSEGAINSFLNRISGNKRKELFSIPKFVGMFAEIKTTGTT